MLSVCLLQLCLKYNIFPTPHFRNKKVTDHDVTDSMEQSPSWESNNHQLAKKFPALYGTRRFVTSFIGSCHQFVSLVRPTQSKNSSHFLKIYFNIILSSTPRPSKWSFSLRSPPPKKKTLQAPLLILSYATCPTHLILLYLISRIIFRDEQNS